MEGEGLASAPSHRAPYALFPRPVGNVSGKNDLLVVTLRLGQGWLIESLISPGIRGMGEINR